MSFPSHHSNLLLECSSPRNMSFNAFSPPSTPPPFPSNLPAPASFQSHLPRHTPESTTSLRLWGTLAHCLLPPPPGSLSLLITSSLMALKYKRGQGTAQPEAFLRRKSDRPPWLWQPRPAFPASPHIRVLSINFCYLCLKCVFQQLAQ